MSFPRYERYKDSGIEWLGEVPEHWVVSALKHQIRMRYGDALASEVREDGDIEVFGSNGPVGLHCVSNTKSPAIVVGRKGSYGKIVWTERGGFVIDTAYAIDSDTTGLNLRWVYYGLQPLGLDSLSQDTGVPGLAREKAYEIQIAVPPHSEQSTIAAFLDRETAKTDALIAEQQRLIELLKEKRQAVISHAVTKGLNPDAPMKDSGIEWLGEVPEHWEVIAFRRVARIEEGQVSPTDEYFIDWILIAPNHIESGTGRILSLETAAEQAAISGKYRVRAGEVVYSKIRPALSKVCLAEIDCLCSADMYPIRTLNGLSANYLVYLMLSQSFVKIMVDESMRVAMPKVNRDTLYGCRVAVPPPEEQAAIVLHVKAEADKYDALTAEAQTTINLLQERRTALISAAVTGKIDVRGLAEAQPEKEAAA